MENINPDDVFNLDLDTVSLITLKNGNILVLDPSVPKKYNTKPDFSKANVDDKIQINNFKKASITKETSFKFLPEKAKKKSLVLGIFSNSFQIINNLNPKIFEKNNSIAMDNFYIKKQKIKQNINDVDEKTIEVNNENNNNNQENKSQNYSFSKKNDGKKGINFFTENNNYRNGNLMLKDINLDLNKPETTRINTNNNNENNINANNSNSHENIGHKKFYSELTNKQNSSNLNNSNKNQESNISTNNENKKNNESQNTYNLSRSRRNLNSKKFTRMNSEKHKINAVITLDILAANYNNINLERQFNDLVDRLNENKSQLKNEEVKNDFNKRFYEMYKKNTRSFFYRNSTMKDIEDPFKNKMDIYFSKNNKKMKYRLMNNSDIKGTNNFLTSYTNSVYNTSRTNNSKSPSYKECIQTKRIKFFL